MHIINDTTGVHLEIAYAYEAGYRTLYRSSPRFFIKGDPTIVGTAKMKIMPFIKIQGRLKHTWFAPVSELAKEAMYFMSRGKFHLNFF